MKNWQDHFAASAQMARQWLDFEANASEFPLLKYVTASDDHVDGFHVFDCWLLNSFIVF
jgi:hypothetical protein